MSAIADTGRTTTLRCLFGAYDRLWRRLHRVDRIDALLSMSIDSHRGASRTFPSGARLQRGDRVGVLHFNHECFADAATGDPGNRHGALRFRRQLFGSLQHLATRVQQDPELESVQAFCGVVWFRPHGEKVGFVVERLPDGPRTRLRILHFRLFLRAFFPALGRRVRARVHPHVYWLTRRDLLAHFGRSAARRS